MAKPNNTEAKVLPILEPIIAEKGLELVDLEFVKEGVNWYLRVYIDKDGGVNIDDCEAVSRALEVKLDEKDPIEQAYILEVSSPGIDRPLKKDADFVKYQGEIIDVKLYKAQDGSKQYQGKLLGLENGVLSIEEENGTIVKFEQKDIASVRLAVIFYAKGGIWKMDSKEFLDALNLVAKEKGIDKEVVFEAIEASLVSACKKNFGTSQNIKVVIDRESGNVACYAQKTVASPVEDPQLEISLEMARVLNPNYVVGDVVDLEVTPKDFGRISAQTAKQVVVQKFREAEREILFNQYITKEREVVTAIVQRKERRNIIVQMGKIDAILSANEQIPGEQYNFMDRIKVYVLEVKQTTKGPQIFVSRTHPELVKRLFEQEVPEVHDGTVEIKSIAREAGSRTKIAVYSKNENVDALGACVGQNGYRVNVIVSELGGEKIDVINWSEDPKEFIAAALSPSKVLEVALNEAEQSAKIVVPDHQLSLAIGKEGQNARLSAKLTGWRIDIKSETQARETNFLAEDPVTEEAAEETTAEEAAVEAVEAAEEDVQATEETAEGEAEA